MSYRADEFAAAQLVAMQAQAMARREGLSTPVPTPAELTAAQLRESMVKRRDKLVSQLSHVDAWRAELALLEGMLAAYETVGT